MEAIFYAILALHTACKPISKENIQAVLERAGHPVDERALDELDTFIDSLFGKKKEWNINPKIIRFLKAELAGPKVKSGRRGLSPPELGRAAASVPARRVGAGEANPREKGRYIYGVVVWDRVIGLGGVGIEGRQVYTLPYRDISAIVHNCLERPVRSADVKAVEGQVRAHQGVLDMAREKFGTVVPVGFDTVLRPGDGRHSPEQAVTAWLARDYARLRALIKKLEGKDEYGVQITYEPKVVLKNISESSRVKNSRRRIAAGSAVKARLYRQKLEAVVKKDTARLADEWFRDFYDRIKKHTDDIVIEKTRPLEDGRVMLLNLTCLVTRRRINALGRELEEIDSKDGFAVDLIGPWPTSNFLNRAAVVLPEFQYAARA